MEQSGATSLLRQYEIMMCSLNGMSLDRCESHVDVALVVVQGVGVHELPAFSPVVHGSDSNLPTHCV